MGKLLKYDFRRAAGVAIPSYIAILFSVLLNEFMIFLSEKVIYTENYDPKMIFIEIPIIWVQFFCAAVILAGTAFPILYMLFSYRQSLFSDAGYLTFVLPYPVTRIFYSKYLTAVTTTTVTLILYSFVSDFQNCLDSRNFSIYGAYPSLASQSSLASGILSLLLSKLMTLALALFFVTLVIATMTFAHLFIKGARFILSALIVFGGMMLSTLLMFLASLTVYGVGEMTLEMHRLLSLLVNGCDILIYLGLSVALMFVARYLLKHHLNLE